MVELDVNKNAFHAVDVEGVTVYYGFIPSGLIEGFSEVTYYFRTMDAYDTDKHEKAVKPLIDSLLSQNDYEYTSWVLQKCEALVWNPFSQITVVSFRIRDSY